MQKIGTDIYVQVEFQDMEYADDICLVSHKYEPMQKKLDDLQEESKKVSLQINPLKTEK